jgi:hydrogenase maturation protein HypF
MTIASTSVKAVRICIDGVVQGVGFRPFVYRLARELSLSGWVMNRSDGVLIHIQGKGPEVDRFVKMVPFRAPQASVISRMDSNPVPAGSFNRFTIEESSRTPGGTTGVSPDIAVCPECLADTITQQRRLDYPLVNCTNCGPRFSIISATPYDRASTSMEEFAMCPECREEYHDPGNRRFHAQPVACNECGPVYTQEIYQAPPAPGLPEVTSTDLPLHQTTLNIELLCHILESGGIVTLKGTGGFNLICDAASHNAVARIREIKGRERKPFAVMFRDAEKVKEYCRINQKELDILESWRRPVMILNRAEKAISGRNEPAVNGGKPPGCPGIEISGNVGGGLSSVGAVLPYMPIHYQLFAKLKIHALVFTSANISGNPIVTRDRHARMLFARTTDAFVSYNREIYNAVDDSVCCLAGGNIQILRRSKGYVPEAVHLPFSCAGIFAAGSDLKNTFAIGKDYRAILSQHHGDMENFETFSLYRNNLDRFSTLFSFTPRHIACDLHPGYHSARFALRLAEETGSSLVHVQHHHAHIASCMAEKQIDEPVIGVCFDGSGFGDDGTTWGSEFLICDYLGYERYSHFSYLPLPGGDSAITEPWRIALACLRIMNHKDTDQWVGDMLHDIPWEKTGTVEQMISSGINMPLSCGAGRMFDAVAALTGICLEAGYEGEAPMLLESICCGNISGRYEFMTDFPVVIDQVMADIKKRVSPQIIASRFHNTMAHAVYDTVGLMHRETGIDKVVLSGGVFQNSYLLNKVVGLLNDSRLEVFTNQLVPANDGGLALGQLAIAAKKIGK